MDAKEFRPGNFIVNQHGEMIKVYQIDIRTQKTSQINDITFDNRCIEDFYKPIPLTEDWLLNFGFKKIPHFTIGNSMFIELGRNRRLSISDVNNPNLMLWIQQIEGKTINDLICIHNWDYDKYLYAHQLQNLFHALTGEELTLKPQIWKK